jgi:hypothetical protein
MSYYPLFWGSVEIYKEYDSLYILERNGENIVVFAFMAVFVSYCPPFWGSRVIYNAHDTQYMFERHDQKLVVLAFRGHFHELLPIVLGFRGELQGNMIVCTF